MCELPATVQLLACMTVASVSFYTVKTELCAVILCDLMWPPSMFYTDIRLYYYIINYYNDLVDCSICWHNNIMFLIDLGPSPVRLVVHHGPADTAVLWPCAVLHGRLFLSSSFLAQCNYQRRLSVWFLYNGCQALICRFRLTTRPVSAYWCTCKADIIL